MDTSNLHMIDVSYRLETSLVLAEFWQVNMDRGSESGTKIRWARRDIAQVSIVLEPTDSLNMGSGSAEPVEDFEDASSLLHRNNPKLILLITPDIK